MDILISSNLERLLFEITGHDHHRVSGWMSELAEKGGLPGGRGDQGDGKRGLLVGIR